LRRRDTLVAHRRAPSLTPQVLRSPPRARRELPQEEVWPHQPAPREEEAQVRGSLGDLGRGAPWPRERCEIYIGERPVFAFVSHSRSSAHALDTPHVLTVVSTDARS
jgi:hypothetical protein